MRKQRERDNRNVMFCPEIYLIFIVYYLLNWPTFRIVSPKDKVSCKEADIGSQERYYHIVIHYDSFPKDIITKLKKMSLFLANLKMFCFYLKWHTYERTVLIEDFYHQIYEGSDRVVLKEWCGSSVAHGTYIRW